MNNKKKIFTCYALIGLFFGNACEDYVNFTLANMYIIELTIKYYPYLWGNKNIFEMIIIIIDC